MALGGSLVEDDVGARGGEADVRQRGREVLELDGLAGRHAGEIGARNDPLEIAGDPFDGDATPDAARLRFVQRAEVDRPPAAGQGFPVAIGERERRARGGLLLAEDVFLDFPLELKGGLGRGL